MKISASIYSWGNYEIEEIARFLEVSHVDYFHVDCNDDPTVFDDIRQLRKHSSIPVDLHVVSPTPEKFYDLIQESRIEMVSFQHENLKAPLDVPSDFRSRLGLSICTGTPLEVFEPYADRFSFMMLMTTVPGQSGGTFNPETFAAIRQFKEAYPQKAIHVDGGVNDEVGFILKTLGVTCAVTGSYLANAQTLGEGLLSLRSKLPNMEYHVREFMMAFNQLPVVLESEASIHNILNAINRGKMGFVALVDQDRVLTGIVTDGDVRRALLRRLDALDGLVVEDMINRSCISLDEDTTLAEMMQRVKAIPHPILFLPVLDDAGRLIGAISFNNLVKGEL